MNALALLLVVGLYIHPSSGTECNCTSSIYDQSLCERCDRHHFDFFSSVNNGQTIQEIQGQSRFRRQTPAAAGCTAVLRCPDDSTVSMRYKDGLVLKKIPYSTFGTRFTIRCEGDGRWMVTENGVPGSKEVVGIACERPSRGRRRHKVSFSVGSGSSSDSDEVLTLPPCGNPPPMTFPTPAPWTPAPWTPAPWTPSVTFALTTTSVLCTCTYTLYDYTLCTPDSTCPNTGNEFTYREEGGRCIATINCPETAKIAIRYANGVSRRDLTMQKFRQQHDILCREGRWAVMEKGGFDVQIIAIVCQFPKPGAATTPIAGGITVATFGPIVTTLVPRAPTPRSLGECSCKADLYQYSLCAPDTICPNTGNEFSHVNIDGVCLGILNCPTSSTIAYRFANGKSRRETIRNFRQMYDIVCDNGAWKAVGKMDRSREDIVGVVCQLPKAAETPRESMQISSSIS